MPYKIRIRIDVINDDIIFANEDTNGESVVDEVVRVDQKLTIVLKHSSEAFK